MSFGWELAQDELAPRFRVKSRSQRHDDVQPLCMHKYLPFVSISTGLLLQRSRMPSDPIVLRRAQERHQPTKRSHIHTYMRSLGPTEPSAPRHAVSSANKAEFVRFSYFRRRLGVTAT